MEQYLHRLNMIRNLFAHEVSRRAGFRARLEPPLFILDTNMRLADVLVQPPAPPTGAALSKLHVKMLKIVRPYFEV